MNFLLVPFKHWTGFLLTFFGFFGRWTGPAAIISCSALSSTILWRVSSGGHLTSPRIMLTLALLRGVCWGSRDIARGYFRKGEMKIKIIFEFQRSSSNQIKLKLDFDWRVAVTTAESWSWWDFATHSTKLNFVFVGGKVSGKVFNASIQLKSRICSRFSSNRGNKDGKFSDFDSW